MSTSVFSDAVEDVFMTERQVAKYLGMQPRTVAEWRYQGIGPEYIRLHGKTIRYRRSAVERWLDQFAQDDTSGAV